MPSAATRLRYLASRSWFHPPRPQHPVCRARPLLSAPSAVSSFFSPSSPRFCSSDSIPPSSTPPTDTTSAKAAKRPAYKSDRYVMDSQRETQSTTKRDIVNSRNDIIPPKSIIVSPKSDIIPPKSDIIPPKSDIVPPKSDIVPPKSIIVSPKSIIVPSKGDIIPPKSDIIPPKSDIVPPKSDVVPPKSDVVPPKSDVVDSADIVDRKSDILNPKSEQQDTENEPPKCDAPSPKCDIVRYLEQSHSRVFENNREWAANQRQKDPAFFENLTAGQKPEYLWIGCSDSRIPCEQIAGLAPGEAFVHRNIANLVCNIDLNSMAVIEYAVRHLRVKHIVVCGHYGCGGVQAALTPKDLGILNPWLRNIRDVYRLHEKELDAIEDDRKRSDRLVELNVMEQCNNVLKTASVQESYAKNKYPVVHGWVFGFEDGLLKELHVDHEAMLRDIQKIYNLFEL